MGLAALIAAMVLCIGAVPLQTARVGRRTYAFPRFTFDPNFSR